jgi:F0F1-type ATP synthase assembly protein I|tara:strand:- start:3697 stop:3870 length:174 start_codon:yes stop_codon:yes gene_type:complete
MEIIARLMVLFALTCLPIGITIGFLTDDKYNNPIVFIVLLIFAYVGAMIWVKSRRKK